ncbi:WAT1-related protein At4g08300-like isoform X5 [Fagus crenata]
MAPMVGEMRVIYRRFKPHILMVLVHIGYTILYLITDASFSHGMNPHLFVTYRHVLGGLVMFPFAYFLERKVRPKMTLALFLEMFLLSMVGVSLTLNMYFACLKYTSPTFVTSMVNVVASLTFVIAGITLKKYPAQLSLTAWINLIGAAQSAAFTVLIQHKPAAWSIAFNIDFWTIIYAGVVCSGITIFVQLWCTEQKGPVFVTMFNPLGTVLAALQSYFLLGESLHMGRILGAVVVILGLYLVLWGKEGDQQYHIKSQEKSFWTNDELQERQTQRETTERNVP